MTLVGTILQLIGSVFQICGTLQMANGYLSVVRLRDLLRFLISALVQGKSASAAVRLPELATEDKLRTLQGLAFIGLGFFIQAIGTILPVFDRKLI